MKDTTELRLNGCRAEPLASYLKALAILRLVSEQVDPFALGWWEDDTFCLKSTLNETGLLHFLGHGYAPTPILAPWNGGSGFYPKDRKTGITPLRESTHPRFIKYAEAIKQAEDILRSLQITEAPSGPRQRPLKEMLLLSCRRGLPDETVKWIDTAYVLGSGGVQFPPLLGTGGNDGRLDFTNNFMQRIVEMIDPESGNPTPECVSLCRASLFSIPTSGLVRNLPIGQFLPGFAGGANAGPGYSADSLLNPWDFILLMEGTLLFESAVCTRQRVTPSGVLSAPFTVRPSKSGFTSAAPDDKIRAEIWVPLWPRPASLREVSRLFSEGRSELGKRPSRSGVDFARSIATLGVDRGISMFKRVVFVERNGQAYLATALGGWPVKARPEVDLIRDLDIWLDGLRCAAGSRESPASLDRVLRNVEAGILGVCRESNPTQWQRLVMAMGKAERQMVRSPDTIKRKRLSPLPVLGSEWLTVANDGSPEFRLAASLASIYDAKLGPLRTNMIPLDTSKRRPAFALENMKDNSVVWGARGLVENLLLVLQRRFLDYRTNQLEEIPIQGRQPARLEDIQRFIEGSLDEKKLEALLWGLNALNWSNTKPLGLDVPEADLPPLPAAYYLLKLAHSNSPIRFDWNEPGVRVPFDQRIIARARIGQVDMACRIASRRLTGSGLVPKNVQYSLQGRVGRRIAAALIFPLREMDLLRMANRVLKK